MFRFILWVFLVNLPFSWGFWCCRHFRVEIWGQIFYFWVRGFKVFVFGFSTSFIWGQVRFTQGLYLKFIEIIFFFVCLLKWVGQAHLTVREFEAWAWCFVQLFFRVHGFNEENLHFQRHQADNFFSFQTGTLGLVFGSCLTWMSKKKWGQVSKESKELILGWM